MKKNSSQSTWAYVLSIFFVLILSFLALNAIISFFVPELHLSRGVSLQDILEFRETMEWFKLLITTINMALLVYLLYNYVQIYQQMRSQFSVGLVIIASALLAHTISSSPLLAHIFGFREVGLGPFSIVPSFFTLIASVVLIHISQQ